MVLEFIRPDVEIAHKCMALPRSSKWIGIAKTISVPGERISIHEDKDSYFLELVKNDPEKTYKFGVYIEKCKDRDPIYSPEFVIANRMPFYHDQETQNTICILRILKNQVSRWHNAKCIPDEFQYANGMRNTIFYEESHIYLRKKQDSGFFVLEADTAFLKTYKSAEFKVFLENRR